MTPEPTYPEPVEADREPLPAEIAHFDAQRFEALVAAARKLGYAVQRYDISASHTDLPGIRLVLAQNPRDAT